MSTMLEQALIDAAALKEAALKNAEDAILERYSFDVRNEMNSLLEQELDDELFAEEPPADDPVADQVDYGATEGETACPCPDTEEVKTYSFTMDDFRSLEDELGLDDVDMERSEDLVTEPGLGTDEEDEEQAAWDRAQTIGENADYDAWEWDDENFDVNVDGVFEVEKPPSIRDLKK